MSWGRCQSGKSCDHTPGRQGPVRPGSGEQVHTGRAAECWFLPAGQRSVPNSLLNLHRLVALFLFIEF